MKYQQLGETEIVASKIGFGGASLANCYSDCQFENDSESIERIDKLIDKCLELGVNYFDTAPWYAESEKLLGKTLGKRPRKSYYIATKIGRYFDEHVSKWLDFSYDRTISSVENSIKLLNCEYIDLVQVHDAQFLKDWSQVIKETLPALDYLRKQGKIKYIGINSYDIEHLKYIILNTDIKIDTISTYTHLTIVDTSYLQHADFFKERKLGMINASPLGMGLITPIGPPKWQRDSPEIKAAVRDAFQFAEENGVDLVKLALNFSANHSCVDVVLSSVPSAEVLEKNVKYFNDGLSEYEENILQLIREKFFIPLNYKGYGNADVDHYWKKVEEELDSLIIFTRIN